MPIIFKGNTSTSVTSPAYNLPFKIDLFTVANKNAVSTTINMYIINGADQISIVPKDLALSAGDMLQGTYEHLMEGGSQILLQASGSVDYYFTISNVMPDAASIPVTVNNELA